MEYKSWSVNHISGQKEYKAGQGVQFGAKRLHSGEGITIRGKKDYKVGKGLLFGAKKITKWGRDYKSGKGLQIGVAHFQRSKNLKWHASISKK